ncbi:MAG: hypothetical protein IH978_01775 [Nitrospinae bacterium]|nr:hypothetical protein [Nitrospinota bacterium]
MRVSGASVYQFDWKAQKGIREWSSKELLWLESFCDHIAANLNIDTEDFDYASFAQEGGLGKVHQVLGDELNKVIEELNENLAA